VINEAGRQQLIHAVREWAEHYDQNTFGRISPWKVTNGDYD
jgi:hypothetical protein